MGGTGDSVTIRAYSATDFDGVAALWTRINRELAPAHTRELFEQYIAAAIDGELRHLPERFAAALRNAFWVVENGKQVVGSFGIESRSDAQFRARELGFSRMILSTAEIQKAAISFYSKNGFRIVRSEIATEMTTATAGGGLTRFHFETAL